MHHVPLLDEIALVAAVGVLVTVILARFRLPTVTGLLISGALLGPFGFGLTGSVDAIEVLAEVGVVLLLFSIGLEFSLARLKNIIRQVAIGGSLQVGLTGLFAGLVARAFGLSIEKAIFYGMVVSLSSTAIVLRALSERRELDAPHGRFIVGALIFQDLCVVPMVLVVPLLASGGGAGTILLSAGRAIGLSAIVVIGTLGLARFVVPKVFALVDASRSREVFLLAVVGFCVGTAWLTSLSGLSLALGAFLGGMAVAGTEYGHRAMGEIIPLRDLFMSLFFVSLGMLFDYRVLGESPWLILFLLLAFILAKGLLATFAALVMKFPARVAWLAGVGLAQFGEFGFVLTRLGQSSGLVTGDEVRPVLAAGILSMLLTPVLVRAAPHVAAGERLLAPLERLLGAKGIDEFDHQTARLEGHVLVIGFGAAGRLVAEALKRSELSFVVLELNAENVRAGNAAGLPVYYGDATSQEALEHAHLETARLVVLLTNDERAAERIEDTVRRLAPAVPLVTRVRYISDLEKKSENGEMQVVSEELEGAVEMVARTMRALEQPRNVIEQRVREIRRKTGEPARSLKMKRPLMGEVSALSELPIEVLCLDESSPAVGRTIGELKLRTETGALVVAVRRQGVLWDRVDPIEKLLSGDVVYVVGQGAAQSGAARLLLGERGL